MGLLSISQLCASCTCTMQALTRGFYWEKMSGRQSGLSKFGGQVLHAVFLSLPMAHLRGKGRGRGAKPLSMGANFPPCPPKIPVFTWDLYKVCITCKWGVIWKWNLTSIKFSSQVTGGSRSSQHGCKFLVTNISLIPHTLGLLTTSITYCVILLEYINESQVYYHLKSSFHT